MFETMQRQVMVPRVLIYDALISACETGQAPERALQVFDAMHSQGMVPVIITYNAPLSACE